MAGKSIDMQTLCSILIEQGLIQKPQARDALAREAEQKQRLMNRTTGPRAVGGRPPEVTAAEVLASLEIPVKCAGNKSATLNEERIAVALAAASGLPYKKIDPLELDMKLITSVLSRPFARSHNVLVLGQRDHTLTVALSNPFDLELLENLKRVTGREITPVISSRSDIQRIITEVYGLRGSVKAAAQSMETGVDLGNLEQLVHLKAIDDLEATDKHIVNAVEYMLHYAFDQRASDIHIEPKRDFSLIRIRIDGVLHNVTSLPKVVHKAIVSRIKMLARMDIAEKRRPQDGRIKTGKADGETELRVSTLPVAFGEKIVIRIFDPSILMQDLSELGFFPRDYELFENFIAKPNGMILVTGPTGSGKTTTLYSALKSLSRPDINIVSIEDPVEMVVEEFNQVAVHHHIGLSFAAALRNILRQDPDVIMVGEVRDGETAFNAVQAALTGHLVFATLHTNDSATAVSRMFDLGVEPFLLSSTLLGVVAQRLVRTICQQCRTSAFLTDEQIGALGIKLSEGDDKKLGVHFGEGCPACRKTGYLGRTAIYEVLPVNDKIVRLINQRSDSKEIMRTARLDGLVTLREAAIKKLAQGLTTFEEVLRVTCE